MQSMKNRFEEEFNVIDMLYFCLSHWKSIIAVGLIGLILGCGVCVLTAPTQEEAPIEQVELTEDELLYQDVATQLYENTSIRVNGLQDYVKDTKIMQLDSYNMYQGTIIYNIDVASTEVNALNNVLHAYVEGGKLYAELEEKTNLYNVNDLTLLVYHAYADNLTIGDGADKLTFTIAALGQDEKEANILVQQIETSMDAYLSNLQGKYAITAFSIQDTSIVNVRSTKVLEYQDKVRTRIYDEKERYRNYKASLISLGLVEEELVIETIDTKDIIAMAVVGAIAGGVLAALVWVLVYIFGGTLNSVYDVEGKFKTKVIGSIYAFHGWKRIDQCIAKKRVGVYGTLPIDEQRKIAILNIKNELKKDAAIKTVFLGSTMGSNMPEAAMVREKLEEDGYKVVGCENVVGRADALEQAMACDVAVILENGKYAKTSLVETEISILKEHVAKVLGLVIVI